LHCGNGQIGHQTRRPWNESWNAGRDSYHGNGTSTQKRAAEHGHCQSWISSERDFSLDESRSRACGHLLTERIRFFRADAVHKKTLGTKENPDDETAANQGHRPGSQCQECVPVRHLRGSIPEQVAREADESAAKPVLQNRLQTNLRDDV